MDAQNDFLVDLPILAVKIPDDKFIPLLLNDNFISYYDDNFGVTSGDHHVLMKLLKFKNKFVLFYVHVPHAYPLPCQIKTNIKLSLEQKLHLSDIDLEFINSGIEFEKKILNLT
ncbi:hypothetical protein N9L02_00805 [Gammaproteobacteria bacterium]|nr:hypothetical protein [Gammaproteobacteria bacterium]